ncbi:MAG: redoxin domain-containing protein [Rubripirellula sp.]|nr:redoxin domain-containing protein [Rubripirellula sp.]
MDVYSRQLFVAVCLMLCLAWPNACWSADPIIPQQQVDDRVHDFELPIVGSKDYLRLSDQYRQGAVVVVVLRGYPGYQCPICMRHVATLANRAATLKRFASKVVLIYPGESGSLEQQAEKFAGKRRLPEPMVIVRDDQMDTVREWGLRWNARSETAFPATYVIDRNGRIRWKKVSTSHAGRSTVEEILKELRKL